MAQQAHNLPWNTLASNFVYACQYKRQSPSYRYFASMDYGYRTDFVPSMRPQQGKNIEHFARVFAQNVKGFSTTERAKYPLEFEPIKRDEEIISEETKATIKASLDYGDGYHCDGNCDWCYSVPSSERDASRNQCFCEQFTNPYLLGHWINVFQCQSCFRKINEGFLVNQIKILLMHHQMRPLLRLASHLEIHLERFFGSSSDRGWAGVLHNALRAYIALNIIYLKPDTWPSNRQASAESKKQISTDYRLTAAYQNTVLDCTATRHFDVQTQPHRAFFGIRHGEMSSQTVYNNDLEPLTGFLPLQMLLEPKVRDKHVPNKADVASVMDILRSKGLPPEIFLEIMDLAEYEVQSRLNVSDDPLHPDNREELHKYLTYCWRMLINSDVLAGECGYMIDWEEEVKECIWRLFFSLFGFENPKVSMCDGVAKPGNWITEYWTRHFV